MDKKVDDVPLAGGFVLGVEMWETLCAIEGLSLSPELADIVDTMKGRPIDEVRKAVLDHLGVDP